MRILAALVVITISSAADATITADHFLWDWGTLPESGEEFFTYRLQVHVTTTPGHADDDDWTAAGLDARLTGGVFHQYLWGGNPPNPAYFPDHPDLEYDTYYTSPADYPNTDYDGSHVGIAGMDHPTELDTDWFDTVYTGNGDFVIQQFTVLPSEPDWTVTGLLQYAARDTMGQLFDLEFTVPEPGGTMLLALGALVLVRQRR